MAKIMKELNKKEYEKVDNKQMKMGVPVLVEKTYNREGLLAMKAKLEAELEEVNSLLAKMDELGVE